MVRLVNHASMRWAGHGMGSSPVRIFRSTVCFQGIRLITGLIFADVSWTIQAQKEKEMWLSGRKRLIAN